MKRADFLSLPQVLIALAIAVPSQYGQSGTLALN